MEYVFYDHKGGGVENIVTHKILGQGQAQDWRTGIMKIEN